MPRHKPRHFRARRDGRKRSAIPGFAALLWNFLPLRRKVLYMKIAIILCLLAILGLCSVAQETRAPEIALRIVAEKTTFALNEKVFVKAEFTNLTSKTLCFPVPSQDCRVTSSGSVVTKGMRVAADEYEEYICQACGGGLSGKRLESAIREKWIKLPPNGVYTTPSAEAQVKLSEVGQWRLMSTYSPPESAFGDAQAYRNIMQAAAKKVGCVVPELDAVAEPVLINATAADQRK